MGRLEESITHYRKVIEIEPAAALAHGNLGVSLEARGDLAGAVRHYELSLHYGERKDAQRNQANLARARQKLRESVTPQG